MLLESRNVVEAEFLLIGKGAATIEDVLGQWAERVSSGSRRK